MPEQILVALITGGLSLVGVFASNIISSKRVEQSMAVAQAVTDTKLDALKGDFNDLRDRVNKHNQVVERLAIVEQSAKSAHHRIDEMKGEH